MSNSPKIQIACSNSADCERYGLSRSHFTPWNWASNWVIEQAQLKRSDDVLDLGCTNNPYVLASAQSCRSLTLCDLAAPSDVAPLPANTIYRQLDLEKPLPFADQSFDVVMSESTLEHLPPDARINCLREARRVLRPGGRICVSIGYPTGLDDNPETARLLRELPFFAERRCAIYAPVSISRLVTEGFELDLLAEIVVDNDPSLVREAYSEFDQIPDLAGLKKVAIVEIGLCYTRSS